MKVVKIRPIHVALCTALVFVATVILQIYSPATRGYFDLGEVAIYSIAAVLNPAETAIAAGIGSAMADALTGYAYYAPGTLVIKATEGFAVAILMRALAGEEKKKLARAISIGVSCAVGATIATIGYLQFTGTINLSSFPIAVAGFKINAGGNFYLPPWIWIAIGCIISGVLLYFATIKGRENISMAAAMLTGAMIMPLGYFLYEYFVLGCLCHFWPPTNAFFEVPGNIIQGLVGLSFAMPIASFIREAGGETFESEDKKAVG